MKILAYNKRRKSIIRLLHDIVGEIWDGELVVGIKVDEMPSKPALPKERRTYKIRIETIRHNGIIER